MVQTIYIEPNTGNLGIGTATPLTPLHVQGSSIFTGNIGIGTAIPLQQLHVVGNTRTTGYAYTSNSGFHVVATHTIANSGANNKITGDATTGYNSVIQNSGIWNPSTGYVTAIVSGYYAFSYSVYNNSGICKTTLRKNATANTNGIELTGTYASTANNTPHFGSASAYVYLAVGDTVSIWNSASYANITNDPVNYFCGYLITPFSGTPT